jgi:DNA integrity scanning protein DisA with diadenylate cyclase activity
MNILNASYFPEAQLRKAVENIVQSLREGGLFITGSNMEQGTIVNGGIYKKRKNRLERIEISGKGSAVDALISDVGAADRCSGVS